MTAAIARKRLAEIGGAAPHEARHVAAALLLGVPVVKATAIPQISDDDELDLGHVSLGPGRGDYDDVRNRALVTLAGPMGEANWPPPHPSDSSMQGKAPTRPGNDGARLWKAIDALGMSELDYGVLIQEARDLVNRRDFRRLEVGAEWLLAQGHEPGPDLLERVQEVTRQEARTVPASAKAIGAGRFTALGDVHTRGGDRIADGAFAQTIKRWQESGEQIPLHWAETKNFPELIGSVDPATLRDESWFGPSFEGCIDLDGQAAQHAWTAVKANAVALELTYAVLGSDEADGVRTLQELDLTGFTLKPTSKGRAEIRRDRALSESELRRKCQDLQLEAALGFDADLIAQVKAKAEERSRRARYHHEAVKADARDRMASLFASLERAA